MALTQSAVPVRTTGLPEPILDSSYACQATYQWRLATLSSGWLSDFSTWSTFSIRPTDIPIPTGAADFSSCYDDWPVGWRIDSNEGVAAFTVEVTNLADQTGVPFVYPDNPNLEQITQTKFKRTAPVVCNAEYEYRVAAIDLDGGQGEFSEPGRFDVPPLIY